MIRIVAMLLSISLHAALLLFALYSTSRGGASSEPFKKPSAAREVVEVQLIQKEQPISPPKPITKPDGNGNGYSVIDEVVCNGKDEKYYGIGIIHGPGDGFVSSAPPQYPAYKAGVRVFDRVLQVDPQDDRRDYAQITVQRNGTRLTFHIRKDYICYRKTEPKNE